MRTYLRNSLLKFHDFIYYTHSYKMYILVSIEELLYGYTTDSLGKKSLPIFVKITEGGLNFYFSFSFLFLFSIFRTRVRVKWQRSCCHMTGHIRWHGHKSHDTKKDVEGSGRMMLYNVLNTCWPYGIHMAV